MLGDRGKKKKKRKLPGAAQSTATAAVPSGLGVGGLAGAMAGGGGGAGGGAPTGKYLMDPARLRALGIDRKMLVNLGFENDETRADPAFLSMADMLKRGAFFFFWVAGWLNPPV